MYGQGYLVCWGRVRHPELELDLLEMISWGPSTLRGGQSEVFPRRLTGTDSAGRTSLNIRTREKLKVK